MTITGDTNDLKFTQGNISSATGATQNITINGDLNKYISTINTDDVVNTLNVAGDSNDITMTQNGFPGKNVEMTVFPNPGNGIYEIKFNAANTGTYRYEILNSLGELIKKDILTSEITVINLQNHANGIYFIRFIENDQTIKTIKVLKH